MSSDGGISEVPKRWLCIVAMVNLRQTPELCNISADLMQR